MDYTFFGWLFGTLFSLLVTPLLVVGFFVLMLYIFHCDKPLLKYTKSRWQQTIPGLAGTPTDFYRAVEARVNELGIPGLTTRVVQYRESGVFSDNRAYLRISRGDFIFDLCAATFGKSLFVSCWLCQNPALLLNFLKAIPLIGVMARLYERFVRPETYYTTDTASIFVECVHACVVGVLDEMITEQGSAPLPETARKIAMPALYGSTLQPA